jgi:DNA-binding CsgD family transcriptional regulator
VGPSTNGGPTPSLTAREVEYLNRLARGETIQEIARACHYEESGARSIGERLRRKLGAKTNTHAVFLACQAGILDPKRRHGDHAGFIAHQRRGEDPWACELGCPEGERAYRRERRAARRVADREWKSAVAEIADAS